MIAPSRARSRVPQDVEMDEIEEVLGRVRTKLGEREYELLRKLLDAYGYVTELVEDENTTIRRLRNILFGAKTEKAKNVIKGGAKGATSSRSGAEGGSRKPAQGHGRNGAEQYEGATTTAVSHEQLKHGDRCPDCARGKVYNQEEPKRLVRLFGQAPIGANVYALQRLRCNLCGKIHVAKAPDGVGSEKYDATGKSMVALLKYGTGMPFNRLQRLQRNVSIPLPASTQWEIVKEASEEVEPVFQEMVRQAAQGEVLHNDDTTMKVLALSNTGEEGPAEEDEHETKERTGVFTSGIVATKDGRKIALFFTGRRHAGENLSQVLKSRAVALDPPIQMCDALSRNMPPGLATIVANCLAHARRQFVDIAPRFPDECEYVLESLRTVYRVDHDAMERGLSALERLKLHQAESRPVMVKLEEWCKAQFLERKVEPNSGLGEAITYLTKHWERLTLFLRHPGAPLDNNQVERALKKAILHRKNALFYKSERGAHVGDVFMTLIHTAELANVGAFDYLTGLLRNAAVIKDHPDRWMPWNYTQPREPAAAAVVPARAPPRT